MRSLRLKHVPIFQGENHGGFLHLAMQQMAQMDGPTIEMLYDAICSGSVGVLPEPARYAAARQGENGGRRLDDSPFRLLPTD